MTSALALLAAITIAAPDFQLALRLRAENRTGVASRPSADGGQSLDQLNGYAQVEPGIATKTLFGASEFNASYVPQLTVRQPVNTWKPLVMHRLQLQYATGESDGMRFNSEAAAAIGEMDAGIASRSTTDFGGGPLGTVPTVNRLHYMNLSGRLGLSAPMSRRLTVLSTLSGSLMDSLSQSSGNAIQKQWRVELNNTANYQLSRDGILRGELILSHIDYPATSQYYGVTPTAGYEYRINEDYRLTTKLGMLVSVRKPRGESAQSPVVFAVGDAAIDMRLVQDDEQQLNLRAQASITPYYDLITGLVEPRGALSLASMWLINRNFMVDLAGQWITALVFENGRWAGTRGPGDDHITGGNFSVSYIYTENFIVRAGVQAFARWREPRDVLPRTVSPQLFGYVTMSANVEVLD